MFIVGTPPISVRLRRNPRARRLTLRLSRLDGQATLTVPSRVSDAKALAFVESQEAWLRKQLAVAPDRRKVAVGETVMFRGETCLVVQGKRIHSTDGQISAPAENTGPRLQAFMRVEARNAIAPLVDQYAARVGRPVNRLTMRDTRSRWGSCSGEGNLMFSWRLVMAPPIVLEYVVAHEVAHLVEMNHSDAFWNVVRDLMPEYEEHRGWLRERGAELHAVDFTS